ncbi:hypothetical protein [Ornithinimicrobium kibberense]|uniref:hypothetical protein n=1 Tax=Ornithinimicrobium kibberense TaxID=282060 RepID=UPI00360D562D
MGGTPPAPAADAPGPGEQRAPRAPGRRGRSSPAGAHSPSVAVLPTREGSTGMPGPIVVATVALVT